MTGTPIQVSEPDHNPTVAVHAAGVCKRAVQGIPPKARLAVLVGSLALVGLAAYTSLSGGSATLNLICHHNLRSADISVSVDGRTTYTDHISASSKKILGIFGKRGETFSKSLTVPSGEHVVEVHLSSATDGFDQTKQRELNLFPGNEVTLTIAAQRSGMSLVYQGSVTAPGKNIGSAYSDSLHSILVTLLGSAASAIIGFVVQEFLRSKKAT